jgi:predicted AAA+ superfamily ATPase
MFNLIPSNDSGSYAGLRRRVIGKIKSSGITERISAIVQETYDDALKSEEIALSKIERKHLMADILDQLLDDISSQMKTDQ